MQNAVKVYKLRLYPTREQATQMVKFAGACRFVWNWALSERRAHYTEYNVRAEGIRLFGEIEEGKPFYVIPKPKKQARRTSGLKARGEDVRGCSSAATQSSVKRESHGFSRGE